MASQQVVSKTQAWPNALRLLVGLVALSLNAPAQSSPSVNLPEPAASAPPRARVLQNVARSLQAALPADARLAAPPAVKPVRAVSSPPAATALAGPAPAGGVISGATRSRFSGLRDPFRPPAPPAAGTAGIEFQRARLPGKRGLAIGALRLTGIVRQHGLDPEDTRGAMIAVVTNSSRVAYFLRAGDLLYDGRVTRIAADAAYFDQEYLDAEGQVKRREVVKRLNAVLGEEP